MRTETYIRGFKGTVNENAIRSIVSSLTAEEHEDLLGSFAADYIYKDKKHAIIISCIAFDGDIPVGFCLIKKSSDSAGYVVVSTVPGYRRQHIAETLVNKCLDLCKQYTVFDTIVWSAVHSNEKSKHMAYKLGFTVLDVTNNDYIFFEKSNRL